MTSCSGRLATGAPAGATAAPLPAALGGRPLRHVIDARHDSFADQRFIELCRARGVAICLNDHAVYPLIDEATADFTYARLMRGVDEFETCYAPADLNAWAGRLTDHARRGDVFAFFIRGGKSRAPAGALAMAARLNAGGPLP